MQWQGTHYILQTWIACRTLMIKWAQIVKQLERVRSEIPPLPSHDYPQFWFILDPKSKQDKVEVTNLKKLPKFQFLKFHYEPCTRHTFRSCLIRCVNMKWIWLVLWKIQSGHNSVHRRTDRRQTDRRTDKMKPIKNVTVLTKMDKFIYNIQVYTSTTSGWNTVSCYPWYINNLAVSIT